MIVQLSLAILDIILCLFVLHNIIRNNRLSDKNKDLQLENSDLIDRNLKLQEELSTSRKYNSGLNSRIDNLNGMLKKKKELLEIQDRLLEENNIKH